MSKGDMLSGLKPAAQALAQRFGLELVDVCLEKEPQGRYLRVYLDKPEGLTLTDCEQYHRALMPMVENYDYDFLEVSSPGLDRPIKSDRDFERNMGSDVELRFYKPVNGQKQLTGALVGFDQDSVTVLLSGIETSFMRKTIALIKPMVDMEGVETVDLSGEPK